MSQEWTERKNELTTDQTKKKESERGKIKRKNPIWAWLINSHCPAIMVPVLLNPSAPPPPAPVPSSIAVGYLNKRVDSNILSLILLCLDFNWPFPLLNGAPTVHNQSPFDNFPSEFNQLAPPLISNRQPSSLNTLSNITSIFPSNCLPTLSITKTTILVVIVVVFLYFLSTSCQDIWGENGCENINTVSCMKIVLWNKKFTRAPKMVLFWMSDDYNSSDLFFESKFNHSNVSVLNAVWKHKK